MDIDIDINTNEDETNRIVVINNPKTAENKNVETKKNTKRVVVNTKLWNFAPE